MNLLDVDQQQINFQNSCEFKNEDDLKGNSDYVFKILIIYFILFIGKKLSYVIFKKFSFFKKTSIVRLI